MTPNTETELKPYQKLTPCWYVKDFADGWIKFYDLDMAVAEAKVTGAIMRYSETGAYPNTRAADQGNQEAVEPCAWLMMEGSMHEPSTWTNDKDEADLWMHQGARVKPVYERALTTPHEPSISLKQLKAICEGMRKEYSDFQHPKCSCKKCVAITSNNAALDQVYEAAEKAVRNG